MYNVFKIVFMPEEVLVATMKMLTDQQKKSYYRKVALIVHPDKNRHSLAKDAFSKLQHAYEVCC